MGWTKAERSEALETLRQLLKSGDTVFCVCEHVARSGMSRRIKFYSADPENTGRMNWLSGLIAKALDMRRVDYAIHVSGCGMDMGFSVVYDLSRALWPDGFECVGDRCCSNDHSNGDRDYAPHKHQDGGYALRSSWL
jgi:hypothetical protein